MDVMHRGKKRGRWSDAPTMHSSYRRVFQVTKNWGQLTTWIYGLKNKKHELLFFPFPDSAPFSEMIILGFWVVQGGNLGCAGEDIIQLSASPIIKATSWWKSNATLHGNNYDTAEVCRNINTPAHSYHIFYWMHAIYSHPSIPYLIEYRIWNKIKKKKIITLEVNVLLHRKFKSTSIKMWLKDLHALRSEFQFLTSTQRLLVPKYSITRFKNSFLPAAITHSFAILDDAVQILNISIREH